MTTTTPEAEKEKTVESPAEQENESFGTWLRRQRELREISLREIADTSKISLRYLQALEDDRFDILPAPVFAKGFLRQYARYVGLDPEEAINFYLAANDLSQDEDDDDYATQRTKGITPLSYAVIVIVIAGLLMAVVWTLMWFNRRAADGPAGVDGQASVGDVVSQESGSQPDKTAVEAPSPETTSLDSTFEPVSSPSDEAAADPGAAVADGFSVTIDFRGDCWVHATVDGETRADRVYTQGESLPLEAQQVVDLELGDAFKADVEVDGHPMDLPNGSNNRVQRVRIDLAMVAALAQGGD